MEEGLAQPAHEQTLVRLCLLEIFKRNGYAGDALLTHRDFEHISREIESKTSTLISVSTLKRLLNGEFSRIPQIATLNALSNYLGFKNWQEYKLSILKNAIQVPRPIYDQQPSTDHIKKKHTHYSNILNHF